MDEGNVVPFGRVKLPVLRRTVERVMQWGNDTELLDLLIVVNQALRSSGFSQDEIGEIETLRDRIKIKLGHIPPWGHRPTG